MLYLKIKISLMGEYRDLPTCLENMDSSIWELPGCSRVGKRRCFKSVVIIQGLMRSPFKSSPSMWRAAEGCN